MLQFNKHDRYTVRQCLNHPFFNDYVGLIEETRLHNFLPAENTISIVNCKEREWMSETVLCLFKERENLEWYNHRCLFQAIDMFQRYLYVMYQHGDAKSGTTVADEIHNEFHTNLLFMACIYISIKYFSSIHYPIPFSNIVQAEFLTDECLAMVEQFEGGLIKNCFQYDIYKTTLYEAADDFGDRLDDEDIQELLIIFTTKEIHNKYPSEVYKEYRDTKV